MVCFKLLDKWRAQGNTGLTIPFIIGAYRRENEGFTILNILKIIVEGESPIHLTYCMNINELILRLGARANGIEKFPVISGEDQNVFSVSSFLDEGNTVKE